MLLAFVPVTLVNGAWPVRMRAGEAVALAWLKSTQIPSVFCDYFEFPFLSYFLPLCCVCSCCANTHRITPVFFPIAIRPESTQVWTVNLARHGPGTGHNIGPRVQAVTAFVVLVVAYTAVRDVGGGRLCLASQPARVGLVQRLELLSLLHSTIFAFSKAALLFAIISRDT